jgi:phosphohistidine phosphatase
LATSSRSLTDDRIYNASPHKLLELVAEPRKANRLVVVGHNPGLHEFALQLIASGDIEAREQLREKLPTSGLVVIELPIEDWQRLRPHSARLERFVTPRLIAAATE